MHALLMLMHNKFQSYLTMNTCTCRCMCLYVHVMYHLFQCTCFNNDRISLSIKRQTKQNVVSNGRKLNPGLLRYVRKPFRQVSNKYLHSNIYTTTSHLALSLSTCPLFFFMSAITALRTELLPDPTLPVIPTNSP